MNTRQSDVRPLDLGRFATETGKQERAFVNFGARRRSNSALVSRRKVLAPKRLALTGRNGGRSMLATPMAAQAVLDREYLEVRAKLLELAASFDRLDRGGGISSDERRMQLVRQGLKVLLDETGD